MADTFNGAPVALVDPSTGAAYNARNRAASDEGGIPSSARLLTAAATVNATLIKGAPGRLYSIQGYNAAAALRYLKLYDKATAPTVGTDTPRKTLVLPATAAFTFNFTELGLYFALGIGFGLTNLGPDADVTALTANDITGLNFDYA